MPLKPGSALELQSMLPLTPISRLTAVRNGMNTSSEVPYWLSPISR